MLLPSCQQLNDERIPLMAVNIDLSNRGLWDTYGVFGIGDWNEFIYTNSILLPPGFPYSYNSSTGYGGVLLVGANYGDVGPLAYDLSCPVERMPDIRVYFDPATLQAICPDCGSVYDVVEGWGAPVSGPAVSMHYGMTRYQCYPTVNGGYIITR